jgi:hypothetical protein
MNRLITLIIVIGLLPTITLGQTIYNKGITNVSGIPTSLEPGDTFTVEFDYTTLKPPEGDYTYWEIRLDGGYYVRDGLVLAPTPNPGTNYHSGNPSEQTFHISQVITIPEDTTPGEHRIKIATCVHPTIWTQVGYYSYHNTLIEVVSPIQTVEIDIKPGSDPNPINPGSNGLIPVAIFTTDDFDAANVDPATVTLAGAEVAVRGKSDKLMAHLEDVDGDGDIDLLLQVDTQSEDALWEEGEVFLEGFTYDDIPILGSDYVVIVPPES